MEKILCLLICMIILALSYSCGNDMNNTQSQNASDGECSESSETVSREPSAEPSDETSAELSAEPSEETSKEYGLEVPTVYGCTKLYDKAFVILGNCEQGSEIFCTYNGKTESTLSDHGFFSIRVASSKNTEDVVIWAEKDGKISRSLSYAAKPKAVSSSQWDIIAGKNYQFHLDYCLADYLHTNLYSQNYLDKLAKTLKNRKESTTAEIIYIVVPSPATIYPETMPEEYVQNGNVSRLDQITEVFKKAGIKYIDVKKLFEEHKNDEYKLYWKTDSHWTDYGAFLVYTELFDYISEKFPDAKPHGFEDFEWIEKYYYGGDMSYYLEYYGGSYPMKEYNVLRKPKYAMPSAITGINRYVGNNILTYDQDVMPSYHMIDTGRSSLPNAVIMRDSYSTQMFDILADGFNKTVYKAMWSFAYNKYDTEGYDYLIYILTERNCDSVK